MANEFAASIDGIYHGFIRFRKHNYFTGDHLVSFGSLLRTTRRGAHPAARVLLVALIGVANFGLWSQLARIADNAPLFNYHSDNKYWDSLRGS